MNARRIHNAPHHPPPPPPWDVYRELVRVPRPRAGKGLRRSARREKGECGARWAVGGKLPVQGAGPHHAEQVSIRAGPAAAEPEGRKGARKQGGAAPIDGVRDHG